MTDDKDPLEPSAVGSADELGGLPAVARLYYTGGWRRYKRASTRSGPGEPLCFVSLAEERIRQAVSAERAKNADLVDEYTRLVRHMEAGGDFREFMSAESKRRFGD